MSGTEERDQCQAQRREINVRHRGGRSMSGTEEVDQCQAQRREINARHRGGRSMSGTEEGDQCQAQRREINARQKFNKEGKINSKTDIVRLIINSVLPHIYTTVQFSMQRITL